VGGARLRYAGGELMKVVLQDPEVAIVDADGNRVDLARSGWRETTAGVVETVWRVGKMCVCGSDVDGEIAHDPASEFDSGVLSCSCGREWRFDLMKNDSGMWGRAELVGD